jgi:phasin
MRSFVFEQASNDDFRMKGIVVMTDSETKASTNGFGMPSFAFKLALPGMFGDFAEQGVARAQEGCEKMKGASEEMAEALRQSYSSTARSATDYGLKVIEISNANTAAAIDFFSHLLASKSVTDVVTLSAAQARRGFDQVSAQNQQLWELAQRLAVETGEPVRKRVTQVFQKAS